MAASMPGATPSGTSAIDPFEAYLLSLSDAASLVQAAITGQVTVPKGAGPTRATPPADATATAAAATPRRADPATVARAAAAAIATATVVSDAMAGDDAPDAADLTEAAGPDAAAAAQVAGSTPGQNALAQELTTDAIGAVNGGNPLSAGPLAAGPDPSSLATDATAKYMGAGFLGPAIGLSLDTASALEAIPAVNGVVGMYALAANTYSNPQGRAFAQPFGVNPPLVPAANGPDGATLDLIG